MAPHPAADHAATAALPQVPARRARRAAPVEPPDPSTEVVPRSDARGEVLPRSDTRGRHERPVHSFRLAAVFVLVLGAVGGGYLAYARSHSGAGVAGLSAESGQSTASAGDGSALANAKARASAAAADAAEAAKKANEVVARAQQEASRASARPQDPAPASCNTYTGNRAIGCALLLQAGFGLDQMPCLDKLFTRESGWNPLSKNSSSGAYGIPQALPGDKMAAYGSDWQTNPVPQIKWGLGYIKGRYSDPCGAWSHSQATGWY